MWLNTGLYCPSSTATAICFIEHMRVSLCLLAPLVWREASCEYLEIEEDQAQFIRDKDPSIKLFRENYWYLHTPDLFRRMTKEHAHVLLLHLASAKVNIKGSSWADFEWKQPGEAERLFREMRAEDIEAVKAKGVCWYLGVGLDRNPGAFAGAKKRCARELVQLAMLRPSVLEALPAKIFDNHPELLSELDERVFSINNDSLRAILGSGKACKYIAAELMSRVGNVSIAEMVSPECFAQLGNVSNVDFENMEYFRSEVATKMDASLTPLTMSVLTREQAAALNIDGSACRHLNLAELSSEAAAGMGGRCLAAFYQAAPANHFPRLGKLWRRFESKVLSDALRIDMNIVRAIHFKDYSEISMETLNVIFRLPEACALVSKDARLQVGDKTVIDSRCFAHLPTRLQPYVLVKLPNPPSDLLGRVDAKMMSEWEFLKGGGGQLLRGFQVVRLAQNAPHLIEKLSSDAREHACRSIPNAPTLLHDKVFPYHITDACFRNLSFQLRPHECQKVPRLWILQNREQIVRATATGQEEVYPLLAEGDMRLLIGYRAFCKNLSYAHFRVLSESAKRVIGKTCFAKLTFKRQLAADDFSVLSPTILEELDYAGSAELNIDSIPNDRLRILSKNAPKGCSALRRLPHDAFLNWDSARLASLDPKQWSDIPPETLASLSPLQIPSIPITALEYWSRHQVARLSKECLRELSPEQLKHLGIKVDEGAIKAINPNIFPKNSAKYKILSSRKRLPWKRILLGSTALVVFAAGGLFLYRHLISKRQRTSEFH